MSKIAIFLANGFEEIEGLTVVDICRRCGLTIDMVSITEEKPVSYTHLDVYKRQYMNMGFLAALAGMVTIARMTSAQPTYGQNLSLIHI